MELSVENMQIELELEVKCSTVSYKCGKCPSEFVKEVNVLVLNVILKQMIRLILTST